MKLSRLRGKHTKQTELDIDNQIRLLRNEYNRDMNIFERIENGINEIKMRGVEPEAINLVEDDYNLLKTYCESMSGSTIFSIAEYKGLQVFRSKGIDGKSFVSIILKFIPSNSIGKEQRLQHEIFNANPEHFIQVI